MCFRSGLLMVNPVWECYYLQATFLCLLQSELMHWLLEKYSKDWQLLHPGSKNGILVSTTILSCSRNATLSVTPEEKQVQIIREHPAFLARGKSVLFLRNIMPVWSNTIPTIEIKLLFTIENNIRLIRLLRQIFFPNWMRSG